jgi:scavenger receptor class B protein 1
LGKKAIALGFKMYDKQIHVTKTAGEWLFEGFNDPMIDLAKNNPFLNDIPAMFDKFGWFYKVSCDLWRLSIINKMSILQKNNTDFMLGDFNVDTGIKDIHNIGNIRSWNHESSTSYYSGECAMLTGSGGDFFNPNITKNDTLKLFSPEMCRSIPMEFEEEVEINGIKTFKFSGGDRAVDK